MSVTCSILAGADLFVILWPIFIVVVGAVGISCAIAAAARRKKELAEWAQLNGLSFDPEKDRGFDDRHPNFKCTTRGNSRYAYNTLGGELEGYPIHAFDYHYATGSGKNRKTHRFSAVLVDLPFSMRDLLIRREGFGDKIGAAFGFDDIDFESAEFSKQFYVAASDRRWAYDVLHQRAMEYLMGSERFGLQFDGIQAIVWTKRKVDPEQFRAMVRYLDGLMRLVPDYVRQQQTGERRFSDAGSTGA